MLIRKRMLPFEIPRIASTIRPVSGANESWDHHDAVVADRQTDVAAPPLDVVDAPGHVMRGDRHGLPVDVLLRRAGHTDDNERQGDGERPRERPAGKTGVHDVDLSLCECQMQKRRARSLPLFPSSCPAPRDLRPD